MLPSNPRKYNNTNNEAAPLLPSSRQGSSTSIVNMPNEQYSSSALGRFPLAQQRPSSTSVDHHHTGYVESTSTDNHHHNINRHTVAESENTRASWFLRHGIINASQNPSSIDGIPIVPNRSPVGQLRQSLVGGTGGGGIRDSQVVVDTDLVKRQLLGEKVTSQEQSTTATSIPWHSMSVGDLKEELELDPKAPLEQGLTSAQHKKLLDKWGPNMITVKPPPSLIVRFLRACVGGFSLMMIIAGILCFIIYGTDPVDNVQDLSVAVMLFVVVLLTAGFQTYQEGKADDLMNSLLAQLAEKVNCLRDGQWQMVDAKTLVPGDYIEVQSGEKVPADLRVLWSADLKVNNASLTGENVDIKLGPDPNHAKIFEAKNIARSGCNFTNGKGKGIIFATGDNTFFGQIAFATTQTERPQGTMDREIHRLVLILGGLALFIGLIFLGLSFYVGYKWNAAVTFAIGIIVANVPEGLLPQLTVAFTVTAKKLFKKQVLVTNLSIIETLGAVTVICSDKTGTLTCNRMTVSHVSYGAEIYNTAHTPKMDGDTWTDCQAQDEKFKSLLRCANLCSDAIFTDKTGDDILKWATKGDASESAIVKFVQSFQDLEKFRASNPRRVAIPFNSSNKYMLSINNLNNNNEHLLCMKGAPERVLDRCAWFINSKNEKMKMDADARKMFEHLNTTLGKRGERVIAFAELELSSSQYGKDFVFDAEAETPNFPMEGLTLLGLISMIDPPRPTVPPAIQDCHKAGVQVFMVTGDHPVTALAISKSLGLVTQPTADELKEQGIVVPHDFDGAIAVHGSDLATFCQADWDHVLKHKEIVFARTQPQQKQDIVRQLTVKGHIVAMTGDGVNDAPALKAAHVGVAMGSGAQVAKEAAQIVLLEDDFSSIVDGIREGRTIFENMKKTINYVLIANWPQLMPFLVFIVSKFPLTLETIVVLCICTGTDILPAIALCYEEPEDLIMDRPPRTPDDHLVTPFAIVQNYLTLGMLETLAMYVAFVWTFHDHGFTITDLLGAGPDYRSNLDQLTQTRIDYFRDFCANNPQFVDLGYNASDFDQCREYRVDLLSKAQGAGFFAVVLGQVGNFIARKTAIQSSLTWSRLTNNKMGLFAIVFMIWLGLMLVYVPGINGLFYMARPSVKHSVVSLWIIPLIIIYEEIRKWLIRRNPDGFFAHCAKW